MCMRFIFFFALLISLALPANTTAQSLPDLTGGGTPFTLSITPQYPSPYGTATLSALSSSLDLAAVTMTVVVDGKNIYKGSVQPLSIPLGRAGSISKVQVTMSAGGANYSQTVSVQPQDVSLIAEPVSSSPPLYPGKPSIPLEGDVRVVAVANLRNTTGGAPDPSRYSYAWTVDGVHVANSSGIGKQSLLVASPLQYRNRDVSVAVLSADGTLAGGASLSLIPEEPYVRIYRIDPLLGILYDRALSGAMTIGESEESLFAAPFSLPTTNGKPFLQWFLNGSPAQTGSTVTLRPTGSGQGRASLSLTASSGKYTTATAGLSLLFGQSSGTNFFGL